MLFALSIGLVRCTSPQNVLDSLKIVLIGAGSVEMSQFGTTVVLQFLSALRKSPGAKVATVGQTLYWNLLEYDAYCVEI